MNAEFSLFGPEHLKLTVLAALCLSVHIVMAIFYLPAGSDFNHEIDMAAAIRQGQPLYSSRSPHPPLCGLLGLSVSQLHSPVSTIMFSLGSFFFCAFSTALLLGRMIPTSRIVFAFGLMGLSAAGIGATALGSLSWLVSGLFFLFLHLLLSGNFLWAALPLSAAFHLKLYPVTALLPLLILRRYSTIVMFVTSALLFAGASLFWIRPSDYSDFFAAVNSQNSERFLDFIGNVTVWGTFYRFFGLPTGWTVGIVSLPFLALTLAVVVSVTIICYTLKICWQIRRSTRTEQLSQSSTVRLFVCVMLAGVLCAPIGWAHYWTILLPLFALELQEGRIGIKSRNSLLRMLCWLLLLFPADIFFTLRASMMWWEALPATLNSFSAGVILINQLAYINKLQLAPPQEVR